MFIFAIKEHPVVSTKWLGKYDFNVRLKRLYVLSNNGDVNTFDELIPGGF